MKNSLFTAPFLVQPYSRSRGALAIHRYPQATGEIQSGFTLIEVLIVIVLAGILMAIAVPNISNFIANGRISSAANDLVSDLMLARGAATSSRRLAVVCATSATVCNPTVTCSATDNDWISEGRLIFVDNHSPIGTADGDCEDGDTILKHTTPNLTPNTLASPTSFELNGFGATEWIAFNSYGVLAPAIGTRTFTLCVTNATQCRTISVDFSGRASVTTAP